MTVRRTFAVIICAIAIVLLSFLVVVNANAQSKAFPGIDSAEKVHSSLQTAIPIGQTITPSTPFKVAVALGDGAKFAKVTPKPFIVTVAPTVENATTPIEEFRVSAVSNDTLTLIGRSPAVGHNLIARTWGTGSFIGVRLVGEYIKSLQDTLNWLLTTGPGAGTVTAITASSPLKMNGSAGGTTTTTGTISIPQASASAGGYLTMTDWSTFNAKQSPISASSPLTLSGAVIGIPQASSLQSGFLASSDWSTFNAKFTAPDSTNKTSNVLTVLPGGGYDWTSAGSGTVQSVNVSGGVSGLSFSNGPITSTGTINLSGGQLSIPYGGTSASTAAQALVNLLPDTTNETSKFLTVHAGGGIVWDTVTGSGGGGTSNDTVSLSVPSILSVSGSPATGSNKSLAVTYSGTALPVANGGTALTTTPANGKLLIGNGTNYTLANLTAGTGTSVTNGAGTITIANTGVTSAAISGPSIISWSGTPITTTGTFTGTLASQTQNLVLASPDGSSGTPTFRALVPADIPNLNTSILTGGTLPIARGGTNSATALSGSSIVISNGSALVQGAAGTSTTLLHGNASGAPTYGAVSLTADVSGALPIGSGGTGQTTRAAAFNALVPDSTTHPDQYLHIVPGGGYEWSPVSGAAGGTVTSIDLSGGTTGLTTSGGPVTGAGTITLAGTLVVANGGTGATSLASNGVLYGGATVSALAVNSTATNKFLTQSSSAAPAWATLVSGDIPNNAANTTGSAATLTTPRAIYGNNFDGSAALAQIIASTYGGTGNGFTKFSGATTSEKTYTLPDASTTILTTNAAVTIGQGGTGASALTNHGVVVAGASALTTVAPGANLNVLQSNGTDWVSTALTGGSGTVTSVATSGGITGGPITTTGTLSLDLTSANVFTAAQTVNKAGIGTTYTNGLVLQNTTASTSGVTVQQSPSLVFDAHGWSTTATAADSEAVARMTLVPASGLNPPTAHLFLDFGNTNRGFARVLDWTVANGTGAILISSGEMQIGTNAASGGAPGNTAGQITDLWLGYGKSSGGGYNATYHAGNGNGNNSGGANFFSQAGIGTGTQLGGEFDWISSFVGGAGSTLNTIRTLMTLVPSGTSGTTAKATLTLGVASSADASIVLKNLTNTNTYTIAEAAPAASRTLTIQDPGAAADMLFETSDYSGTAGQLLLSTSARGVLGTGNLNQNLTFDGTAVRTIKVADAVSAVGRGLTVQAGNGDGSDAVGGGVTLAAGLGTGAAAGASLSWTTSFPISTGSTPQAQANVMKVTPTGTSGSTALATLTVGSSSVAYGAITLQSALSANSTTIKNVDAAAARTYTLQDVGANANFVMTQGAQTLVGVKSFSSRLAANGGMSVTYAHTSAATYTAAATDYIVGVDCSSAAIEVDLPAVVTGQMFLIKDESGTAATHNITVKSLTVNIDGNASKLITTNYGALMVYSDGTNYFTK